MLKRHWPCVLISIIVAIVISSGVFVMTGQAQEVTHHPSGVEFRVHVVEDYECIHVYNLRSDLHWQCFAPPEGGILGLVLSP